MLIRLGVMNHLHHNRLAWNRGCVANRVWSTPVDSETIARARAGTWQVILTPKLPVPRAWFGEIQGKKVLCLASGGGQQAPILSAAGANVTSFDLSDEQLARDRFVADRDGLQLKCVQGDMADLSCFANDGFDLIFHPASNVFVPDVETVWRECYRVLRKGGSLLSGFMNPAVFLFDHHEADQTGLLQVRYSLPYSDLKSLEPEALQRKLADGEALEFSHSLDAQIGGQLSAGFVITGFYEDRWFDDTWLFSNHCPVAMATQAVKA
jgi:SAM-dependent methyltransferase